MPLSVAAEGVPTHGRFVARGQAAAVSASSRSPVEPPHDRRREDAVQHHRQRDGEADRRPEPALLGEGRRTRGVRDVVDRAHPADAEEGDDQPLAVVERRGADLGAVAEEGEVPGDGPDHEHERQAHDDPAPVEVGEQAVGDREAQAEQHDERQERLEPVRRPRACCGGSRGRARPSGPSSRTRTRRGSRSHRRPRPRRRPGAGRPGRAAARPPRRAAASARARGTPASPGPSRPPRRRARRRRPCRRAPRRTTAGPTPRTSRPTRGRSRRRRTGTRARR